MNEVGYLSIASRRVFGAWACLVAVALLWAPMLAAAWQADAMACCYGNMCPTHGHAKTGQQAPQTPVNCNHHGANGIADCSMSCAQETSPPLGASVIFVLPQPEILSQPSRILGAAPEFVAAKFVQSTEPLSPPPRTSLFFL
jgi:hypothetical protein